MNPLEIELEDNILIIAPHPDDECIGPGGILSLYPQLCTVLVLTDGAIGQDNLSQEESREIRKNEFLQEMQSLGIVDYFLLNFPDGSLMNHLDCLEKIELDKYNKVFVTSDQDGHADHTAALLSLLSALKQQENYNSEIYLYEVHQPLIDPTCYLDLTDTLDKKLELISYHQSQLCKMPYDDYAKTEALYRGYQCRMPGRYIEVYKRIEKNYFQDNKKVEIENLLQKFRFFYNTMTKWLEMESKYNIVAWLKKEGINSCSIYGYAELGKILEEILVKSDVKIKSIIDQNNVVSKYGIKAKRPDLVLPDESDIIIVTAVYYYDDIRKKLEQKGLQKIISLDELIDKTLRM